MGLPRMLAPLLVALTSGGCLHEAPDTDHGDDLEGACAGTEPGRACVTLAFELSGHAFDEAPGDLVGDLHWGLYENGTVGGFGPREPSIAGDFVADVDMADPDVVVEVTIPNLEPDLYQALGFLDDDGDGESSGGDPVSLPSKGFRAPADLETRAQVFLNYIR